MPVESSVHQSNPYELENKTTEKLKSAKHWYPTLLLNLDFKKSLPEEGVEWLFVRVSTKQIKNGRMDLDILILDEVGDIVALSHHVALILGAERNLAQRNNGATKI